MSDKHLMESLVSILRNKSLEIAALNEEVTRLRGILTLKKETVGVGDTDRAYSDDGARGQRPVDDEEDRYATERREYTLRRKSMGRDSHDHQDVTSTLVDNDPSGSYASGEDEVSVVPTLRQIPNRSSQAGTIGYDVTGEGELDGTSSTVTSTTKPAVYSQETPEGVDRGYREVPIEELPVMESTESTESTEDVTVTDTSAQPAQPKVRGLKESKEKTNNRFLRVPVHLI